MSRPRRFEGYSDADTGDTDRMRSSPGSSFSHDSQIPSCSYGPDPGLVIRPSPRPSSKKSSVPIRAHKPVVEPATLFILPSPNPSSSSSSGMSSGQSRPNYASITSGVFTDSQFNSSSPDSGDNRLSASMTDEEASQFQLLRRKNAYLEDGSFTYTRQWPLEKIISETLRYKKRVAREKALLLAQRPALQKELSALDAQVQRVRDTIAAENEGRQRYVQYRRNLKHLVKAMKAAKKKSKRNLL